MLERSENVKIPTTILVALFSFSLIGGNMIGLSLGGITISAYRLILICSFAVLIFDKKLLNCKVFNQKYLTALIIWFIISLLQCVYTKDIGSSIKYILVMASAVWVTILANVYIDSNNILKLVSCAICVTLAFNLIFCLIEIFTGKYFNLNEFNFLAYTKNIRNIFGMYVPIGFLGNPNDLALFCLCGNLFIHIAISQSKNKLIKIVFLSLLAANIFVWISANSRTGFLSLALFYLLFILLHCKKSTFKIISVSLVCIFSVLMVLFLVKTSQANENSDSVRLHLILNGFEILFKKSFGLGVGLGNVEIYMSTYTNVGHITNIHNWIMEILVSGGVINFIIFVFAYAFMIIKLFKLNYTKQINKDDKKIVRFVLSFVVIFLFASISPSSCMQSDYVWSSLAVSAASVQFLTKKYGV